MKATITIRCEVDGIPEERVITVLSLISIDEIEKMINDMIERESINKGWNLWK